MTPGLVRQLRASSARRVILLAALLAACGTDTTGPDPVVALIFSVSPGSVTAGVAFAPAIQVTALDARGNTATAFTGPVTLSLGANPGGAVLQGTTTVSAVAGIATFTGVSVNRSGAGYTLEAAATGLPAAASTPFTVSSAPATQLAFTVQPGPTVAGTAIAPAIAVTARDPLGNTATDFTGTVTLALATNPGGATLAGTLTATAVAGVATFTDVSIDKSGVGYTLQADASGLPPAASAPFAVTAAAATHLVFSVQPGTAAAGTAIAPAVQVTARDVYGNTATGFTGAVSVAIGTNPAGGALTGTTAVSAVAGVASFGNLLIDRSGSGYTLTADATGLGSVGSDPFDVTAGQPSAITLVSGGGQTDTIGATLAAPFVVRVTDAVGNGVSGVTVTWAVTGGGGSITPSSATDATGHAQATRVLGITAGAQTATASASGLTGSPVAFASTATHGIATQLAFTAQPTNAGAGAAITPAVQVTAGDRAGNAATSFTGIVTLAIGANPPGTGALDGTTSIAAVAGVATFPGLNIDEAGAGYTLAAAATGLTGATSAQFTISAGAATQLSFTVQPGNTGAGAVFTPSVQVTARDAFGNAAPSFVGTVTLAIGTNPPGTGVLDGPTAVAAVAGVASFPGIDIDEAGVGYTLTASAPGLTGATSTAFTIGAGVATQLAFTVAPSNAAAGAAISPVVQVTARDGLGNTATGFTGSVTLAIGTNPPGNGVLDGTVTVSATAGVASFPGINIDEAGAGYTLTAGATGLTGVTSVPFAITAGAATQLAFTQQPTNTAAGATITPTVQVSARDAFGNTATGFTGSVTLAIGINPPGNGALDGTVAVSATAGVASFPGINIDEAGAGYTLTAGATGLTGATSAAFTISAGAATQLAFTQQPANTAAGATILPAVEVTARDAFGNTAPTFTNTVTLAIGTNPPGNGVLDGTAAVAAVAGVASFPGLNIDEAGAGYTLTASAAGLTGATSATFTITAGGPALLVFTQQPTNAAAGAAFAPVVQVTARDALGNTATGFTGTVTVAIGTNPPSIGVLDGTTGVAAVAGVASFPGLNIDEAGVGYTLTASATGLTGATSDPFTIAAGAATQLAFTQQPTNTAAGATMSPAVQVTARDAFGNTAPAFTGTVTLAIGTNPPGNGVLDGTTAVAAVASVATFPGLDIDEAGAGYTLTASATGLTGATSAAFAISAGPATQLAFTQQPINTAAGAAFTPAIQVTARDALGNTATSFTGSVTVAIGTNPPGNGVLDGTAAVAAVAGVASFPGLNIDEAAAGYTLTANATGLTGATSTAFAITAGSASQLVFTVEPSDAAAGAAIVPAIQVTALDAAGNTAAGFTGTVTLAIGTNPPGNGVLDGTNSVAAVAGVATFPGLNIDEAGAGYTLTASASGLTGATSTPFTISAGAATQLAFTQQPTSTAAGAAFAPVVQVTARDAFGNTASAYTGTITVAIGTNPPGNGVLDGTTAVAAVAGVANFPGLDIDEAGNGYTLAASATGLTGTASAAFNITASVATQLAFTVHPGDAVAGAAIFPAIQVTARDAAGNTATGFTGTITLAIGVNPPGTGVLDGTTSVAAVAGIASFPAINIDEAAAGYTLTAGATGLTGATSATFTISAGAATQLAFTGQPSNTPAGAAISPPVQVTARDSVGNTATTFTGTVAVAIGTNPPPGGVLDGTTSLAAVAGVATFPGLNIDEAGAGYTLTASATGLTGATSASFNVTAGAATQLAFTVQPGNTAAGAPINPAVQVTARDALGNTATGFTGNVTLAIGTNPPGTGVLDGTTSVAAVGGIATFPGIDIDEAGTGYTLTASATGLTGATSAAFNITSSAATQLAFTVQPGDATAGAPFAPAIQVTARDAAGNTATGFTGTISVAIGTNPPPGGVLDGTASVAAVAGVATFPGLNIDEAATGYTLTATATGLTGATSSAFTISAGAATQLAFTVQPSNEAAGAVIAPAVQVTARDGFGNPAPTFVGTVTVAIGTNPPGSGVLDGTTSVAAVAGVATFTALDIDEAGIGYTLTASATGVTGATSTAFTISPGAATQLAFTVQPSNEVAGVAITPIVQVTARDALGNTATGFTGNVTLAIGTNPPGTGVLDGTTSVAAAAGVASFPGVNIDEAGTGYTLTAAAAGLSGDTSTPFNITVGAANRLAFTVQPGNTAAGVGITPAIQVTARDSVGNAVTGFTGTVTLGIGTNPPGNGALDGTSSLAAVAGVATFSGLNIDEAGAGYTLTASATGLTGATSSTFTIAPGTATQLAFAVQPSNTVAGAAITPAVQITARDSVGNTATAFTGTVTLAIGVNPPGTGVLDNATPVAAVGGVATFPGLNIDEAGAGYTLVASAGGVTDTTSNAFTITAGAATQLAFTVPPSNAGAGATITPAVQVTARDAFGNTAVTFAGSVMVAIGTNPSGGVLAGTLSRGAAAGVAIFNDLSINQVGSGYTLTASATGLTGTTSTPFTIGGGATQLAFTVQPSNEIAGVAITPAVQVTARDAMGNPVAAFTGNVTITIAANPGGSTLSGTATVAAVAGVATFTNLSLDRSGSGYTLQASATGLASATSGTFAIAPAAATRVDFLVQPTTTPAGSSITPAVRVRVLDAFGNIAGNPRRDITVALLSNPAGATLSGTIPRRTGPMNAADSGVAVFNNLSLDKVGVGYTLVASTVGLASDTSAAFDVTPGQASQLAFTVQPTSAAAGAAITPAIQVTARDASGNTAAGFTGNVTLDIGTNPPGNGALDGTTTVAAVAGVATFSGLDIDEAGGGYTLTAAAGGLTGATSNPFTITPGAATQLAFTEQPTNTAAGAAITPAVQVTARDALGNTATGFTGTVTLAIGTNPPGNGVLDGTTALAAVAGVATFPGLNIDEVGAGYTLTASATGLSGATSIAFSITGGGVSATLSTVSAATDSIGQCLAPCVLGFGASRVTVTARDPFGNPVAGVAVTVSVASPDSNVFTNPGASGVTDASGVFQADFASGTVAAKIISAVAGGTSITRTDTVHVMPTLTGAGDIADCNRLGDDATATLLDGIPGGVFALGDNAYPNGRTQDFANCYEPTWGRHKARTRPAAGNHEYDSSATAAPYFAYFGANAGTAPDGYYSYDVGTWHVVVLNDNIPMTALSPQVLWLRADLNGRRNQCVLAYWHRPRYSSGPAGNTSGTQAMWQALADSAADIVMWGHDHTYERFAPMNGAGAASPTGQRAFVVGTGGGESLGSSFPIIQPNSEVRDNTTRGVLRLTLYDHRYRWEFLGAPGFGTFTDSGNGSCN